MQWMKYSYIQPMGRTHYKLYANKKPIEPIKNEYLNREHIY